MSDLTTLRALKARVDAATGADTTLDAHLYAGLGMVKAIRCGPNLVPYREVGEPPLTTPPLTASIDAAVGLVERLKPRADDVLHARLSFDGEGCAAMIEHADQDPWHPWASGANLSLAILSALLSALIVQAEAGAEESA